MLIKSELSQYKIELIDCFGEHQSQLFYGRIRIYNPCWNNNSNKCSRSLLDIKLGQTIPLDISDGNNQPVLCIPIHFFQRLNDKHNEKNRETTSGYTTNNTTTNNNGCIQLKNGFHKSSSDNVDYNKINNDNTNNNSGLSILSYDSLNEFTHQSSSSNEIDTIMEWNNKIISNICQANSALATIRVYFPVKLMNSANELKISTDLKKRFHLPPHQHEFVAYPELLTLSIDQLCVSILKGLSTAHSLIPYTLSMPKEFCKSEKSQLMQHNQLHPGNTTTTTTIYNDDMMKKTEENNHDVPTSSSPRSSSLSPPVIDQEAEEQGEEEGEQEIRFLIVNRGVYNRMNALIQISKEKMLIMPKRVNWSLAITNNHKNLTIHQKFIDVNNLIKSSSPSSNLINKESIEHTHVCTSDPNDNMADINHIKSSNNNNIHNNKNSGNNKGVDSHDTLHCNGYIRDWVGLSIDDKGGCEQNDLMLNNISNSQCLPVPTTSLLSRPDNSCKTKTVNGDHVSSCHDNCQTGSIRIAFVRRESSECGNSIAPHFIQNKYSPAKLRRSRLRGTDHLVIKFKRNSLSKDYYPNEIVTNSFAQSVCDKFCNYNSNNNNNNNSNTLSTATTVTASNNPTDTTTTDTIASITSANNNNNGSTDKQRIRCDQNKILCILTSPLNYSSNYYPRNTCYDSNRLLSPTTLTSSSIASRVKWGANLTLQTNYTSANHDTNGIKVSSPIISQYNSEINSKESNQYFNSFNNLSSVMMRKASHDEFDKIILHPRPRIPPKRLDLANQDLELALKRSLSDCTMQVSNKRYYNNSIKKSLAYTARIKNQHNTNRESTNENLARRRKTVLRTKRRRHRPFTTRRQKSRSGNIKIPHKFTGDSVTTMSADNSFTSIYSSQSISDDSLLNESDEKNKTINGQISRLPLPKLTLAKNRDGEFNVVENREENTVRAVSDATDEEYKPATQRITNSTSNDSESTDVSDSYTPVNNSLGNTTELCKSSKRKCVNKQRTNCLSNKRMKNRTSQESSEDDQKSNGGGDGVYDLNSEEVKQDMNIKHNLSSCVYSSEGIKTTQSEIPNVVCTNNNFELKPTVNSVTPSQSVNSLSNSSAFLPELTITPRVEESKNSPICFTTVESVQSGVNNLPVSSYFPSTINAIPSSHPICSTSSNQSFTYLSPIQPVTMWSRLASPLPAPDPPTKLFNTKRIPAHHQSVNNNNNKCQPFPMIIPANSVVCSNQMTSQLPQYLTPNPNRTSIPIPIHSTSNLPSDVLFNRNANMNLSGLTTNPMHFNSTFCNNFPSLSDLNSKQILQNCNKIQLTNQGCSSSFPNAIHPSLPPVGLPLQQQQQQAPLRLPTQLPHSLSFPYAAPSSSSYTFNGNQTSWSSSIDQFINNLSNPYISNISENIPVCYGTSVVLPPGNSVLNTNPTHNINSSNCNNQNNFVSYPFFIPHPILRNISQSNNNPSLSTPVPGSYPASLQSVLGTSFMLGGQNYNNNNTTNVQNYAWIPPSF